MHTYACYMCYTAQKIRTFVCKIVAGTLYFGKKVCNNKFANGKKYAGCMSLKEYQKIILYLYPKLSRLIGCAEEVVRGRALASASDFATERCIEKILGYLRLRDGLLVLRDRAEKAFSFLSDEERFLLEYKYFRRRSKLEGEFAGRRIAFSERTYFRRQSRLAAKLSGVFTVCGLDEDWFMRTFGEFPSICGALERLRSEGEKMFSDKRAEGGLFCSSGRRVCAERVQNTSSVSS